MTSTLPSTGLELRSIITGAGELQLSLVNAPIPTPKADEVVVRIEASVFGCELPIGFGVMLPRLRCRSSLRPPLKCRP